MLKKLANIAKNLDYIGDYDSANTITNIMMKYAQEAINDDNLLEVPPAPIGLQEWPHFRDTEDVDLTGMGNPHRQHYRGMADIDDILSKGKNNNIKKFPSKFIGRKRVTLPYGTSSKLSAEQLRRLRYTPESLTENANGMEQYFGERTKGGTTPRVFDVNYESTDDPSKDFDLDSEEGLGEFKNSRSNVRRYLYTPEIVQLLADTGITDDSNKFLPFLEYDQVQAMFNSDSEEFNSPYGEAMREKIRNGVMKIIDAKTKAGATDEEIKTAKAKYILGNLVRKINPEAVTHLQQSISTRDKAGRFQPHFGKQGWEDYLSQY